MFHVSVRKLKGSGPHLQGFTLGELHLDEVLRSLEREKIIADADSEGLLVMIDFQGIESATTSYLKATLLRLLRRSALSPRREPGGINVFPVVANAGEEILDSVGEISLANDAQFLVATAFDDEGVRSARVLGKVDLALRTALDAVTAGSPTTATALKDASPETVSVTAWNNRLAELLERRLVRRRRLGKQHQFLALARAVTYG